MNVSAEKINSTKLDTPTYCCLAILESCFMKCKMCYKWQSDINLRSPDEPTVAQWKQFIADLAGMGDIRPTIHFAGGEPLVRGETLDLIAFASRLGLDTLLATNAYLIEKEMSLRINEINLKNIVISLDGVNKNTHDFLRGTAGSFERVQRAIEFLQLYANKVKIDLATVISAVNLNEIVALVEWASQSSKINGIAFQAVTQPFSTPEEEKWYENPEYSFLWPKDLELVNLVMDRLIELKTAGSLKRGFAVRNPTRQFGIYKRYFEKPEDFVKRSGCHLYSQALNVTPDGEAHLCFYKPSIGNIKSSRIQDIWFSEKAKSVREQIKHCRKNCQALVNCNFDETEDYVE
ncbi:MAG: radical SAM protein [Candidatus Omnitrophica bacterium]|nr:radical SAM protein [Candidatus Omnitrophota bacterium]